MTQTGVLGAYKRVTPRAVDEGAIAENIANTFAAQQTQRRQEKATELLLKQKQAKLDAEARDKTYAEMQDLAKMSDDATTIAPIIGAKDVAVLFQNQQKKKYADLMRRYEYATGLEKSEIRAEIGSMAKRGDNWKTATTSLNNIITETLEGMGTVYDGTLSMGWVKSLVNAMQNGRTKGGVELAENKVGWGDYITIEDVGNGNVNVVIKDDDGNALVSGNLEDIGGKIAAGRTLFVDSDKEFLQEFGKGLSADLYTENIPYDDMLKISEGTDLESTRTRLNKLFDAQYGSEIDGKFYGRNSDGKYSNKFIEKEIKSGGTYEQTKKRAVDSALLRMKEIAKERMTKDPEYARVKKEADLNKAATATAAFWRGDQVVGGNLLADTPWNDPLITIQSPKLKGYKVVGDVVEVEVTNSKGEVDVVSYDRKDPAQFSTANNLIHTGMAKDIGGLKTNVNEVTERTSKMDLTPIEGSKFVLGGDNAKEYTERIIEAIPDDNTNFDGVISRLKSIIKLLESKGLSVDLKEGPGVLSNYKMTVKDDSGNEVAKIDKYYFSAFKEELPALVEKALKHNDEVGDNNKDGLETVIVEGTSYRINDLVKNERVKNNKKWEGLSDEQIRKAIIDRYGKESQESVKKKIIQN